MKLEIDNLLTLSEVPFGIGELIKERLTLVNPQYHKMLKMGNARAAYGLPPHFKYYQESNDKTKLRIGRGNLTWLKELCEKYRVHLYGNDMTAAPYAEIAPDKVIPFRDYQQGVVEEILTNKNGIVRMGTGSGKTLMMLAVAQKLQTRTLIIVPRKTLADQTVSEAQKFLGITPARLDKDWNERRSPIHVVTIQTLQHKSKEELLNISKTYGLVCVDECFVAGTEVSGMKIEEIKIGDFVDSFNHKTGKIEPKRVLKIYKKETNGSLQLTELSGVTIISTLNHPFYVRDKGYIPASNLSQEDDLCQYPMCRMSERYYRTSKCKEAERRKILGEQTQCIKADRKNLLFKSLLKHLPWKTLFCENDKEESDGKSFDSEKNVENIETNRSQTEKTRRQWSWNDSSTGNALKRAWVWMVSRISSTNEREKRQGFPDLLQVGYSESSEKDWNRDRRRISLCAKDSCERQEEGNGLVSSRVENTKILEQGCPELTGLSDKGNYVYNIEVDDNNNYFANGILVHNCHTAVPQKTRDCIQAFSPRHLYGFTGTARRTDGQGAAIEFIFGDILVDEDLPSTPPRVEVVKTGRNYWVFEYHELAEALSEDRTRNELIAGIVKREIESGRKLLVFTKRCSHRDLIYEQLKQTLSSSGDGIHVIKASGNAKEKLETQELLATLRSGERDFSVLVSTHSLLSVGFDCPSLDTLLLAGDLRSDVLAEQSAGRLTRLFEGKKDPKIIDLMDSHGILYNQFKARLAFYKSKDWQVTL